MQFSGDQTSMNLIYVFIRSASTWSNKLKTETYKCRLETTKNIAI